MKEPLKSASTKSGGVSVDHHLLFRMYKKDKWCVDNLAIRD